MPNLIISDTFDFSPSSRVYLDNGFLRVTGKAARTGVYQYLASELGLTDRTPNAVVNVYRPHDEVFNADSLASYSDVDVTNEHPSEMVTSKTYKNVAVGHVVKATQSPEGFVDVEMVIKDATAIADIEAGKSQLSPGYTAVYVEEKGASPEGESYEFKQTGIDVNHVAIVKRGRGGAQVRIDDNQGVIPMIKVMLDSGQSLEVADEAGAKLVTDTLKAMVQQITDAQSAQQTAEAQRDAVKEQLDTALIESSDEAIAKRVEEVATVGAQARKIVGDTFTCDSVDTLTIQRAALKAKRPTVDWAEKSEAYVQAAFDMAFSDIEAEPPAKPVSDQYRQLANDSAQDNENKPKVSSYDAYKTSQAEAWKGAQS